MKRDDDQESLAEIAMKRLENQELLSEIAMKRVEDQELRLSIMSKKFKEHVSLFGAIHSQTESDSIISEDIRLELYILLFALRILKVN